MSVLSAQSIEAITPMIVNPFVGKKQTAFGMSYGLSVAGYDIRVEDGTWLMPGEFWLASSLERFQMPNDVLGVVHDKSTWARQGIALQNTVIEPGWSGFLTLEVTNHSQNYIEIESGSPIAQIIFHRLDQPTDRPYRGKYQNQNRGPQVARFEQ